VVSALIVSEGRDSAQVYGVHGAAGLSRWGCLGRRAGLDGDWEAIEWASVPPGGVSGEHAHTRTEEIYFVLSGAGELLLDGRPHRVEAGDMALTKIGGRHGLRNIGSEPLDWLVIEILSPVTAAVIRARPRTEQRVTKDSMVVSLRERGEIDPRSVFSSPLEAVRITRLGGRERQELRADGSEHTVFVLSGSGVARSGEVVVPVSARTSLTLPLGTGMTLEADAGGLEFFHATLRVDGAGA
jgi:mannose-6-phosphate isomerase-like protein (cupin superfamily)